MSGIITKPKLEPVNFQDIQTLLEENKSSVQNAITKVNSIESEISKGMTPELDNEAKFTITRLKATKENIYAKRMPLTKKMDEIKSFFTKDENTLQSLADELQKHRNEYAAKVAKENAEKQRLAQMEQFKTQELIDLKAAIEIDIRSMVQNMADKMELGILNAMKTVTNDNKDEKRKKLESLNTEIDHLIYGSYESKAVSRFGNDVIEIGNDILIMLENELAEKYRKQVDNAKHEALLMFNQIASMSEETKNAAIEAKEQEAIIESKSTIEVIHEAVSVQADSAKAEASFTHVVDTIEMPDAKKTYEIVLLDEAAGYSAIVPFWFATCAKDFKGNWSTRTFNQCLKDLEKYATINGVKLESKYIEYRDKFKAK